MVYGPLINCQTCKRAVNQSAVANGKLYCIDCFKLEYDLLFANLEKLNQTITDLQAVPEIKPIELAEEDILEVEPVPE